MNSLRIPRAAEAVSIHTHGQVSQDKKVKLHTQGIPEKSMCCQVGTGISAHLTFGNGRSIKWLWTAQQHPAPKGRHFIVVGKQSCKGRLPFDNLKKTSQGRVLAQVPVSCATQLS